MRTSRLVQPALWLVALSAALIGAPGAVHAQIKDRNVKLPIVNNIDHPQGVGAKRFAELVEQKSAGKSKVRV